MLLKRQVSVILSRYPLPHTAGSKNKHVSNYIIHQVVREDAHLLFGFHTRQEREMFRLLLTVSGIGANTARMMLSSLTSDDIQQAILRGNAIPACKALRESDQKPPSGSLSICAIKSAKKK